MSRLKKMEEDDAAADEMLKAVYEKTPDEELPKEAVEEPPKEEVKEEVAVSDVPLELQTPEVVSEPPKEQDDLSFKAKYEVLKGKYDKETPRAIKEANQAKGDAAQFKAELQQWKDHAIKLQQQMTKLDADLKAQTVAKTDKKIEELAEIYPDIAEVLRDRDAKHALEMEALENKFQTGVKAALEPIHAEQNESREERFDRVVREQGIPNWREIDVSEGFHQWLDEKVPYTPYTRMQLLKDAAAGYRDPYKVAQFFKDYTAEKGSAEVKPQQNKFDKYVAPPKSTVGTSPSKVVQETLSWAQYKKFMDNSARGKFNPKDWGNRSADQVEAWFDKAILAGRMSD